MNKDKIRNFILNHCCTRELFFIIGKRKTNLRKIDKALKKRKLEQSKIKANNVIISLTTYGERINELKYTLYSLVKQSIKPEKIIVNIAYEDEKYINTDLRDFEQFDVEFYLCEDIRSYKKLIPTLKRYPDACIITTDDDIYYEKNWLKKLYEEHKKYPNDVCCHLVYKITHDNDKINTYQKWIHNYKIYDSDRSIFLLGASGVLYPKGVFYKDILNNDLFMKLAPIADDMWFWFMVNLNEKSIRQIKKPYTNLRFINPYREYGISEGTTLMQQNVGENKNDIQFKAILDYYKISQKTLVEYFSGQRQRLTEF